MPAPAPSPETLELALLAMAVTGANAHDAAAHLATLDPPVILSEKILRAWKTKYAQRYTEIQQDRAPILEAIVLEKIRETILQASALQTRVLEALIARLESGDIDAKDLSTILKAAGVSLGINVEKMLLLTNRPTVIAEKRDVAELLQSLSRRVPGLIVGSAEEIEPAKGLGTASGAP